jgi:alkylated DNA repair dioxygenase AlkB
MGDCLATNLVPYDGEVYWQPQFYSSIQADALFSHLMANIAWQTEDICLYGRWHKVPRLMAWYGDAKAHYQYSGVSHQPLPWTEELASLRDTIGQQCGVAFNSVLLNLYRNGQDSMGCHADDEPELGNNPVIASLSLGDSRLFRLRHKTRKTSLGITLGHGDLLVMAGSLQHYWLHSVPKTTAHKTARINLTFRTVYC